MTWDEEDSCCEEEEALARKSEMRNKVEVCDKGPEENPYKAGTMWAHKENCNVVVIITQRGYLTLSNGFLYDTTSPKEELQNYTQVYCVTIKRDRSG